MIYFLLSFLCVFAGAGASLGASTLLRPLLEAVSPLSQPNIAALMTMCTLSAALISAFFALAHPLPLAQEELLFLAAGGALGGVIGEMLSARFIAALTPEGAQLLQNALIFSLLSLSALYLGPLRRTLRPLSILRAAMLPAALIIGLFAGFLSFGAYPLSLAVFALLFDADEEQAAGAALTVTLSAMAARLISLLIRSRFSLPGADMLLFLLPGAAAGALFALLPAAAEKARAFAPLVLLLSLFTSLLNIASALAS